MTDPMTPTPDLAVLVEEVLAEHGFSAQAHYQGTGQWVAHCLAATCKWSTQGEMGGRNAAEDAHRAHVTAALVSRLGPVFDAQFASGYRAAIAGREEYDRTTRADAAGVRLHPYEVMHDGSGRPSSERDGPCTCDYNPETTGGPEEDCPFHGRPYAEWVDRADTLATRAPAAPECSACGADGRFCCLYDPTIAAMSGVIKRVLVRTGTEVGAVAELGEELFAKGFTHHSRDQVAQWVIELGYIPNDQYAELLERCCHLEDRLADPDDSSKDRYADSENRLLGGREALVDAINDLRGIETALDAAEELIADAEGAPFRFTETERRRFAIENWLKARCANWRPQGDTDG